MGDKLSNCGKEIIKASSRASLLIYAGFIMVVGTYLLLFGNYRLEAIDDAWCLSFVWNFMHNISFDPVFRFDETFIIFGKTQALLYAPFLDLFGWTRNNAHFISLTLVFGSVIIWCKILRHLKWSHRDILIFALLLLLFEPFLGAANLTRPEALCFFLFSGSLFLFMKKHYFTAVFIAFLAFETHPLGVISFFYFLAWGLVCFSRADWLRAVPRGIVAAFLGVGYFFWINGTNIDTILATIRWGREYAPSFFGTFSQYFIYRSYYRHVPELIILLTLGVFYIRSGLFVQHRFLSMALLLTFIGSVIIRRGGYIYIIYYFPLFIMMMVVTAVHYRKQLLLVCVFLSLLLPQYFYLWWHQGGFHLDQYVTSVRAAIPQDEIPIVGSSNNWFAFKESGRFYDYRAVAKVAERYKQVYTIEGYFPPYNSDHNVEQANAILPSNYNRKTEISSFIHFGKKISVYRWERE